MNERRAKLILVLVSLGIGLVMAEILSAVVLGRVAKSPLIYDPSPYTSFTLVPGIEAQHNSREFQVTYKINKHGYRGPAVDRPKPAGRRHILLTGDSFAFGHGVEEDRSVCAELEARFKKAGQDVEVINAGFMAGTSPDDAYAFLVSPRAAELEPDGVIELVFMKNDMRDMSEHEWVETDARKLPTRVINPTGGPNALHGRGPIPIYKSNVVLRNLSIAQLIGRLHFAFVLLPERAKRLEAWADDYANDHDGLSPRFVQTMQGLVDECRQRAWPLVVGIIPTARQTRGEAHPLYDAALARLKSVLDERGAAYVVLDEAAGIGMKDLYPLDSHWKPSGHEAAAKALHARWTETATTWIR